MSTSRGMIVIAALLMIPQIGFSADKDMVRVRLAAPARKIQIEAQQGWIFSANGESFARLQEDSRLEIFWSDSQKSFVLSSSEAGAKPFQKNIGESFPLRFELQGAKLYASSEHEHVPLKNIPEKFEVLRRNGLIEVQTRVKFADYLLGVLHREMPGAWPMEALKSQVIATRSYTLAQMKERASQEYDVDASVMDQEFEYVADLARSAELYQRWLRAIRQTDSKVLRNPRSEILKAYYHADCGGRTTTPDFVWGPQGDYKSVRDPSCEKRARNQWKMVAKKSWLQERLRGVQREAPREPALVRPLVKAQSLKLDWIQSLFDQRVTLVEWWDGFGDLQILSGQNFRQLLGFGSLKSLRFQTKDLGDSLEFKGQGFGHGVGLCQWGARDWAEQGMKSEEILRHYYPLARIR